jgi:hypothetical protein
VKTDEDFRLLCSRHLVSVVIVKDIYNPSPKNAHFQNFMLHCGGATWKLEKCSSGMGFAASTSPPTDLNHGIYECISDDCMSSKAIVKVLLVANQFLIASASS